MFMKLPAMLRIIRMRTSSDDNPSLFRANPTNPKKRSMDTIATIAISRA
jgi:hypothetical protein